MWNHSEMRKGISYGKRASMEIGFCYSHGETIKGGSQSVSHWLEQTCLFNEGKPILLSYCSLQAIANIQKTPKDWSTVKKSWWRTTISSARIASPQPLQKTTRLILRYLEISFSPAESAADPNPQGASTVISVKPFVTTWVNTMNVQNCPRFVRASGTARVSSELWRRVMLRNEHHPPTEPNCQNYYQFRFYTAICVLNLFRTDRSSTNS